MRIALLRELRRHVIVRALSVLLIALVVTPFTQPFAACDVLDVTSVPAHGDEKFGASDAKCMVATATVLACAVAPSSEAADLHIGTTAPLRPQAARPLVLRI